MTNEMLRWIQSYERLRTNPFEPNELWVSTKYDIVGVPWSEIKQIFIPELDMTWGPACNALKKSWHSYKSYKKQGTYRGDIAYRIIKIQRSMGIPESEFKELDNEWAQYELSQEEKELKNEEQEEGEWDIDMKEEPEEKEEEEDDETWEGI